MKNKILFILLGALINAPFCFSAQADSLRIDSILHKSKSVSFNSGAERLLFFAGSMKGIPYQGGTLDRDSNEKLVVRTDSLDCTTYVENVLALYLASAKQNPEYRDYIESLTRIRYRESGYYRPAGKGFRKLRDVGRGRMILNDPNITS